MTVFDTPEPIQLSFDLPLGEVRLVAGPRGDTVVEVRPSDRSSDADVRAAELTRVDFSSGRLALRTPKQRALGLFGRSGSVDVTVELPEGSSLDGVTELAQIRSSGRLGACRVRVQAGDVQLDRTAGLDASSGSGNLTVQQVEGDADLRTANGRVQVGQVDGTAVIKTANGGCRVGRAGGDLWAVTGNGEIIIEQATAQVTATSANGDLRVGAVGRDTTLKTARGQIEVGLPAGTAARLTVRTDRGQVRNLLTPVEGPQADDVTVDVQARTRYGDVVIRRAG